MSTITCPFVVACVGLLFSYISRLSPSLPDIKTLPRGGCTHLHLSLSSPPFTVSAYILSIQSLSPAPPRSLYNTTLRGSIHVYTPPSLAEARHAIIIIRSFPLSCASRLGPFARHSRRSRGPAVHIASATFVHFLLILSPLPFSLDDLFQSRSLYLIYTVDGDSARAATALGW